MNGSEIVHTRWAIYGSRILVKHVGTGKAFKCYLDINDDSYARLLVEKTEAVSGQGML